MELKKDPVEDTEEYKAVAEEVESMAEALVDPNIRYGEILIYQTEDGLTNINVKMQDETVWLTQQQLVELYQSSKSNVSEHIKHIFEEGELDEEAVVRKFRTTASDGKNYNVIHYNLDMIISLGYRIKSSIATQFR